MADAAAPATATGEDGLMLLGLTLSRHIGGKVARTSVVIFAIFIVLVTMVDLTETSRLIGTEGISAAIAIFASLMRAPSRAEEVLPFAVLFAAMITFVQLNRRLELTITRAAGVSPWQVLFPAIVVAFLLGVVVVTIYNPAASALRDRAVDIGAIAAGASTDSAVWLRQNGNDGPSIIGAQRSADDGTGLADVVAFLYAPDGTFRLRLDAPEAHLVGNEWLFADALVTEIGLPATRTAEFSIHTNLSLAQIRESLADPATVAFWRLPGLIGIANAAALPATDLRMRLNTLLALPFLLVAMVLIAAVVTLRFSRTLNTGRLVITGPASGFMLYIILVVSGDLGRGGVVPPEVAAWAPVLLATLVSVTLLLRGEDG